MAHAVGGSLLLGPVLCDGVELLVPGHGLKIQAAAQLVDLVQHGVGVLGPLRCHLGGNRGGGCRCALRGGRSGQCGRGGGQRHDGERSCGDDALDVHVSFSLIGNMRTQSDLHNRR